MKEIELTGEINEKMFKKLKDHIGQKICQYSDDNRFESTLIQVDNMNDRYIFIRIDPYGEYEYAHGVAPPIFLCIEENETFEEMVKRKQKDIFRSLW